MAPTCCQLNSVANDPLRKPARATLIVGPLSLRIRK
jgi:hypothetical protein